LNINNKSPYERLRSSLWCEPKRPAANPLLALGASIKTLPLSYWEPAMLFAGAKDLELRKITGFFPATMKGKKSTHPIFSLKSLGNFGIQVCPCTSRRHKGRFIKKSCNLEVTNNTTDRDSYLLEEYSFPISVQTPMESRLRFLGIVPERCLGTIK